jgi:methyltransferase, FkbM family
MINLNDPKIFFRGTRCKFTASNDEDNFIIEYFNGKRNGFIVDVGAAEGVSSSNSFRLINEYDWSAFLIEPYSASFKQLKYLYGDNNKIILENVAVSSVTKKAVLYLKHVDSGCHSLREPETKPEDPNDNRLGPDTGTEEVLVFTLNDLFKKHNIKNIDVLSVDTEGNDLAVLQGLNFEEYKPKIITVEYAPLKKIHTTQEEFERVIGSDYKLMKDTGGNYIFILKNP